MRGQVAHVPHTIVTPFNYGDGEGNGQFYGQQQAGGTSKSRHLTAGNMVGSDCHNFVKTVPKWHFDFNLISKLILHSNITMNIFIFENM